MLLGLAGAGDVVRGRERKFLTLDLVQVSHLIMNRASSMV